MKPLKPLFQILLITTLFQTGTDLKCQVSMWEETITLPAYDPEPADKNPIFYVADAYQGASRVVYPYALRDNLSVAKVEKKYKALFLENEYVKLCLLPELGGRLFYATDKTNGYEFFYRQHVIKPANIGMLGAWISGGIEWCVFHHHRASSYLPVDYRLMENEDGSKTIWFGEIEPRHRMKWSIGLTLHPGRSYMETDVRMYNKTANTNSFLYWANVATHVNEDYQVIFPPSVHEGVYHAKNSFIHWPVSDEIYNGRDYTGRIDVSWWKNHPEPISIFAHDMKEDFMGGYDHGKDAGTIHVGNHHIVKGAKLWEWGPGEFGHMWDCEILTDSDGPYAEIMVGAYSDNQPDYSWISPGEVKSLKQYWYPVREMGGFKNANLDAAVNLEQKDENRIRISLNTTRPRENCSVLLKEDGVTVFDKQVNIAPDHPFSSEVTTTGEKDITHYRVELLEPDQHTLISYQEKEFTYKPGLPETVKPPQKPGEIEQIESLVLTGQRIMQFHNPGYNAEDYFNEALRRDPLHSLANLHMGNLSAMEGKYEEAAGFYRKSISRITAGYTRPRDCEALYRLGVVLKAQGKYEDAIDTLYRATWDQAWIAAAHFELGGISMVKGAYEEALDHFNRSLAMNAANPKSHDMKSALLRQLGDSAHAIESAQLARTIDPLDHMAAYELLLLKSLSLSEFRSMLNHNRENYLELVTDYLNSGLYHEAEGVVEIALSAEEREVSAYPILLYYAAFLHEKLGNDKAAGKLYTSASGASTDYVFPFRFETLEILDAALQRNPGDAKAWYYKGNILYDHQPEKAIACWEKAVELDPELAIAYRNLGWGQFRFLGDHQDAIRSYEKALSINRNEPRYYYELDLLYEMNNEALETRYKLFAANREVVRERDDSYIREIEVLLLNGKYDDALVSLTDHQFIRREGAEQLHDFFVDAHLLRGREYLRSGEPGKALEHFLLADTYPENQKIGRISGYEKEAQIFYFTGLAYKEQKQKSQASNFFRKAAELPVGETEYLYYRALSQSELGLQKEAEESSARLFMAGKKALENSGEGDFFAKFGEKMNISSRKAYACYSMGLAASASGDHQKAKASYKMALDLKNSILWANVLLGER
ncbi:MAG: DUF5107 domain-containing protein [Bacteroidota bacterium]